MKNLKEHELRENVRKYIIDKRNILKKFKLLLPAYKKSKKALKNSMNESVYVIDIPTYRGMKEISIKRLMSSVNENIKKIDIKSETRLLKISECFDYSIRFIEKDLNNMLNEKYFSEIKRVKISDDITYNNMLTIINLKKEIIDEHFKFLLNFYKMIPSLISKERENNNE